MSRLFDLPPVEGAARRPRVTVPGWMVVELVRLDVAGLPAPQGSKSLIVQGGHTRMLEGSSATGRVRLENWRANVAAEAQRWVAAGGRPTAGPLAVELTFRLPRLATMPVRSYKWKTTKPDFDKLTRAVCDALTGLVWHDDAQVCLGVTVKRYAEADETPGCAIVVGRLLLEGAE